MTTSSNLFRKVTGSKFETVYKPGRPIDVPC